MPKTIDSREPAYTKRACRPSETVEPWKPPPFALAQVKPKLCGRLVKSAGICKEAKHIHATVHSALRTVSRSPVPKIPARRGDVHISVQLVYLAGHTDKPVNAQGVPSIPGTPVLLQVGRGSGRGSAAQQHTQSALAKLTQVAM